VESSRTRSICAPHSRSLPSKDSSPTQPSTTLDVTAVRPVRRPLTDRLNESHRRQRLRTSTAADLELHDQQHETHDREDASTNRFGPVVPNQGENEQRSGESAVSADRHTARGFRGSYLFTRSEISRRDATCHLRRDLACASARECTLRCDAFSRPRRVDLARKAAAGRFPFRSVPSAHCRPGKSPGVANPHRSGVEKTRSSTAATR
jgi:hypothetical protein